MTFSNLIFEYFDGVSCFFRCSHQCSMKKGVLRNFAKSTGKHLQEAFFRRCARDVVLWILQNFWEHFFLQNISGHGTKIRIIVRIIVPCSGWMVLFFRYPDSIVTYLFKLNKIRPEQHSTKCGSALLCWVWPSKYKLGKRHSFKIPK